MLSKQIAILAALALTAGLVHAEDTAKTDPKTGKACVTYMSSESTQAGLVQVNFRNTCDSPFRIQIMGAQRTRAGSIESGTPGSPAKGQVICRPDDRCETAKWQYQ